MGHMPVCHNVCLVCACVHAPYLPSCMYCCVCFLREHTTTRADAAHGSLLPAKLSDVSPAADGMASFPPLPQGQSGPRSGGPGRPREPPEHPDAVQEPP